MKDAENATNGMERIKLEDTNGTPSAGGAMDEHDAGITVKNEQSQSPAADGVKSQSDGADTPNAKPRLSRKSSHKTPTREPPMFDNYPDMTSESCKHFQVILDCLYGSKHLGSTEHDAFDCECREEWRKSFSKSPCVK
jgi:histone-lysine N-methyltransferase SETD2